MLSNKRLDRLVKNYEEKVQDKIETKYEQTATFGEKVADRIAQVGGSWGFIIGFNLFLLLWVTFNTISFTSDFHFDVFPFILLNLGLSWLASVQAPIIMMSQNRQAQKEKAESTLNYAISLKSEQEIDDIQKLLYKKLAMIEELKNQIEELKEEETEKEEA